MNYTISLRLSLSVEGDTLFYIQFDNLSIDNQNMCSNHVSAEAVTIEILEYSIKIRAQSYYQQQI